MKTRGKEKNADLIIGMALKRLRLDRKLSRNTLAPLVGVSGQQIAKYENGDNRIAVSTLLLLLDVLGVSMSGFMTRFNRIGLGLTEVEARIAECFSLTVEECKRMQQFETREFDEKI